MGKQWVILIVRQEVSCKENVTWVYELQKFPKALADIRRRKMSK
jgi:hypothetical protein